MPREYTGDKPTRNGKPARIATQCGTCGNTFMAKASRLAVGWGKYCSRACFVAAPRQKHPPSIERICAVCGGTFNTHPSTVKRGSGTYCSRACQGIAQSTARSQRVQRVCQQCGAAFDVMPSVVARGGGLYCSRRCRGLSRRTDSAVYRSSRRYKEWRAAVLQRDAQTCQHCGKPGRNAHHVKPWAQFPALRFDVANGLTLCRRCHAALHPEVNFYAAEGAH